MKCTVKSNKIQGIPASRVDEMLKKINYLLDVPKTKWRKSEWKTAAEIMASDLYEIYGPIGAAIAEDKREELRLHILKVSKKKKRGRPLKYSQSLVSEMLPIIEARRALLVEEKKEQTGLNKVRISDKAVANSFAKSNIKNYSKSEYRNKQQLSDDYRLFIKRLKEKK